VRVVAHAGHRDRDPGGRGAVGTSYGTTDGHDPPLGTTVVDREALPPDVAELLAESGEIGTLAGSLGEASGE